METRREPIELFGIAHGVNLNTSVILIAHPSAQPQGRRIFLDKPAETDALYAARNKPAPRLDPACHYRCKRRIGPSNAARVNATVASVNFQLMTICVIPALGPFERVPG